MGGELQGNQNNIPHGLSSPRRYIPAGAEGGDSSLSSSTNDEEVPLQEELDQYFSNPAYRAHNPALLEPVEPEEDWGDTPPVLLPIPIAPRPPPPASRIEKRQRFLQRRRKRRRQHEWEGDHH